MLPHSLKALLEQYEVSTVSEMGCQGLKNGVLLQTAANNKFDLLLTVDKKLEFQQNLNLYNITIVVFDVPKSKLEFLSPLIPKLLGVLKNFKKRGAYYIS